MVITAGSGTSDLDIAFFREHYLTRAFKGVPTTLMTTRYITVDNWVVQSDVLGTLGAVFEAKTRPKERSAKLERI
jgi:hypothetical protein